MKLCENKNVKLVNVKHKFTPCKLIRHYFCPLLFISILLHQQSLSINDTLLLVSIIIIICPPQHGLTGQSWYSLEASRAVNQAVGRVIRHKDDYGAVILCDSRFAASNFKTQLSAWIRPYITNYNKFGPVMKDISQFFRQALTSVSAS